VQPQLIGDKERFIISHGSYQNRWKISITPDRKVRWTIRNTQNQVRDIDSETVLEEGRYYHIGVTYDGSLMMIYINGMLETFTTFTGNINPSPVALEMGQQLPDDNSYNFRGILDEIRIFDYALWPDSVAAESGVITATDDEGSAIVNGIKAYPNPSGGILTIDLTEMGHKINLSDGIISILDLRGREVFASSWGESPTQTIFLTTLYPGLYILRLTIQGKTFLEKLIVK
jgi:hypothetical protein